MREVNPAPPPEPPIGRYSNVYFDGDLWEARSITGRSLLWGATEEEAAYAARVYLELTHNTFNRRLITDAEPTVSQERTEEIRHEVVEAL